MPHQSSSARLLAGLLVCISTFAPVALAQPEPPAKPAPKASTADDAPTDGATVRKSLVKIFTTSREPNLTQPWVKQQPSESSGSGVVIDGKRILTNNHVIEYATRILVQPDGSSDKINAKVIAASPGIDLAVIELTDKDTTFFDEHPPITINQTLPDVGQTVWAYGYPLGGDAVSITKGVISRIEHTSYNDFTTGLRIQVDAAINPGNSGGPAVMDGKLVGLAFSGIGGADNIGYLIPVEEINAFLEDIKDGNYVGRPQMFHEMQTTENVFLRAKLGLTKDQTGLMVSKTDPKDASDPLKEWDILSAIGDHNIDNTGMVSVRDNLRLSYHYFVPKLAKDGHVPLTVIRDGKEMHIDMPVSPEPNRLFRPLAGGYPRYFIVGPMCFTAATKDHADRFVQLIFRGSPLATRRDDKPKFEGEELVLGPFKLFSHPMMKGYEAAPMAVLKSVNDVPVKSLKHLVELIRDSKDKFLVFRWDDNACETMVFDREAMISATDDILEEQQIRNQMSDDLKDVWKKK